MPGLLYAANVCGYTKKVIKSLERAQMSVAKAILGVHPSTSSSAVRGVIGWIPMEIECILKLLAFWARILRKNENTFISKILNHMRTDPNTFTWYKRLIKALEKNQITPQSVSSANWVAQMSRSVRSQYWEEWSTTMRRKGNWAPYTPNIGLTFDSAFTLKERALLNQLRLGDTWSLYRKRDNCPLCNEQTTDASWWKHLLIECATVAYPVKVEHEDEVTWAICGTNTQSLKDIMTRLTRWKERINNIKQ